MSKILYITPMWYEEETPNDAKVCNFFVDDWKRQGHDVVVAHYRTSFPSIYFKLAAMFPKIGKRICGDNSDISTIAAEKMTDYNGSIVFSTPLFKYIPHGSFSKRILDKEATSLIKKIQSIGFEPDAIIGHFCNPTIGIINRIAPDFPNAKTAVVLHEGAGTIRRIFKSKAERELNALDSIGFRSVSIKDDITGQFQLMSHQFMCYSGVASSFVEREYKEKVWTDCPIKSFLYVGRMSMYKHPQSIAEAVHKVYGSNDFSITYIGKKEAAYQPTSDYCENNGLKDKVAFLGQINREDIINWYDKSDCFVMISDHEVFGLVYLEAMARGCLTIAGNNGGMVGIIENGVNGFLCEPGDAESLANIIRRINAMTADERQAMSQKARETALRYSDNKVAQYYIENVLKQHPIDYHEMKELQTTKRGRVKWCKLIYYLYSKFFKKVVRGRCVINSSIHKTSHVDSATEFHNSQLDRYSYVGYDSQVFNTKIGSFCSIGDFFLCGGASHPSGWVSTSSVFYGVKNNGNKTRFASFEIPETPMTTIGHDVWCGLRVTIKAGVNVGTGAIIGAGSVVTHDVPPYAIVAGVPAKVIKYRFEEDLIRNLLESKWWELPDEKLKIVANHIRQPEVFLLAINELNNKK